MFMDESELNLRSGGCISASIFGNTPAQKSDSAQPAAFCPPIPPVFDNSRVLVFSTVHKGYNLISSQVEQA